MILLHIIGRLIGLTSGAVALSTRKGGTLHRKSGTVFVYAMLVMSASGAVMAALKPERVSVIAGLLTFYLVLTAHRRGRGFAWMDAAAMSFGLAVGITAVIFSMSNPSGEIDGPPPALAFIFGACASRCGSRQPLSFSERQMCSRSRYVSCPCCVLRCCWCCC